MNPLGVAAAAFIALKLFSKAKAVEDLKFKLKDVAIDSKNTNIKQIAFVVRLYVTNPNKSESIEFNGFAGVLALNDIPLAKVTLGKKTKNGENVRFPAGETKTLVIPVVIDNLQGIISVYSFIASILKMKTDTPVYERSFGKISLKGEVQALQLNFPVETYFDLKLPKNIIDLIKQILSTLGIKGIEPNSTEFSTSGIYGKKPIKRRKPASKLPKQVINIY